jgi:hypothetical protein
VLLFNLPPLRRDKCPESLHKLGHMEDKDMDLFSKMMRMGKVFERCGENNSYIHYILLAF